MEMAQFKDMSRLRTIPQVVRELSDLDPHCAVSEYAIRWLADNGKINFMTIGNRRYVSIDEIACCFGPQEAR